MKRPWYKIIDFYRLTGLTLLWISSWLFMLPSKANIQTPFFNNIWGELLTVLGISKNQTIAAQQTPDLISGLIALLVITILQLRGILSVAIPKSEKTEKENPGLYTVMNIFSIIVHTLFFTMLVKIFVFPNNGTSTILQNLQANIAVTIFTAITIAGMIFGAQSIAKILMILFVLVSMFKNINFVNSTLGPWGFVAMITATCGFYLEFCFDSFNRHNLLLDLNFFLGKYNNLQLMAQEEFSELKKLKDSKELVERGNK
ncbi:MAG: hypothetical protein SO238_10705 [Treponema sp.]|nr:hypothetical protein [Spirochaetia bacterium]MDY4768886.1 hypothetical protein [Treponema sp.]